MPRTCQISAVYPRLLMQSGLLPGPDMLRNSGVSEQQLYATEMIDWQVMATMFQNLHGVMKTADWTIQLGTRFGISTHGSLGFAALSAPNLRGSFQVISEYMPVRTTALECTQAFSKNRLLVEFHDRTGDKVFFGRLCEMILKNLEVMVITVLGESAVRDIQVHLPRPQRGAGRELAQAFDSQLVFSASSYAIRLGATLVHRPSVLHDEPIYRASIAKCVETLARRAERFSVAAVVRRMLQQHFDDVIAKPVDPEPPPRLEHMADRLHLTSRTLIRRLEAEQTSYKNILLELRQDYACSMLCDARLTVADIAERLGYREPANFGRAFKSWFGVSPAAWRRQ